MIFGALAVALMMLPRTQRSSLSIQSTWEIGIAAAVDFAAFRSWDRARIGAIDFWLTFGQNKFQVDFGAICEPEFNHVGYGTGSH